MVVQRETGNWALNQTTAITYAMFLQSVRECKYCLASVMRENITTLGSPCSFRAVKWYPYYKSMFV